MISVNSECLLNKLGSYAVYLTCTAHDTSEKKWNELQFGEMCLTVQGVVDLVKQHSKCDKFCDDEDACIN